MEATHNDVWLGVFQGEGLKVQQGGVFKRYAKRKYVK